MGMPNSKFGKEIPNDMLQKGSLPSTPIMTPKSSEAQEQDPRSPSLHIARTPLDLVAAATEKLELCENDTPLRNKNLIIGPDPRSPTIDFKRTPIIISSIEGVDLLKKIHNKNLDKARLSETKSTPLSFEKKSVIPPRLLESSPIKPKADSYKRRSLVGLLETNIDFTETDIDTVIQEKSKNEHINGKDLQELDEINNVEVAALHNPNVLGINSANILEIPDAEKTALIEKAVHMCDKNDVTEMNICKEHDESSEEENPQLQCLNKVKSVPSSPQDVHLNSISNPKESKSEPITPPSLHLTADKINSESITCVNLTADVKELDKKLTNLIYEDDLVVCPRIIKLKETTERSPLKTRNGIEPIPKSGQKLKVSDKPRRSDYAVSKIPVFKEKRGSKIKKVQCENTPPRNIEKRKTTVRKSEWDNKDITLYL